MSEKQISFAEIHRLIQGKIKEFESDHGIRPTEMFLSKGLIGILTEHSLEDPRICPHCGKISGKIDGISVHETDELVILK